MLAVNIMMCGKALLLCVAAVLTVEASAAYPWPDNVTQHKGYIEVNKDFGVNLFYWFFESRNDSAHDPLVVWLTGGPGCSSELALLAENGPFLLLDTKEPVYNKFGWNSFANLLYIDNPGGTGFSYVENPLGYAGSERTIASELWDLIRRFYDLYPKYSNLDLYIIGESYAGHYVPALGQVIVESNSKYAANLKGIGMGNGWVDPFVQYHDYGVFAYQLALISEGEMKVAQDMYDVCKGFLDLHLWPLAFPVCQLIESFVLESMERTLNRSVNPYDVREVCEQPPLCYTFVDPITKFMNQEDVRSDLGVGNRTWESCKPLVELRLIDDWVKSFQGATATVLGHGRRVLVYSGKEDFICNYVGGMDWANGTQWSGQAAFDKEPLHDWLVDGKKVGEAKSASGLTFLEVEEAGHMVPYNQPQVALDMLQHFLLNKPFY